MEHRTGFTRRQFMLTSAILAAGSSTAWGQGKPLKIGIHAPFSGVYSSLGEHEWNGYILFFEQHGMKIAGRPLVLLKEDSEGNPQAALRKVRKLVEQDQADIVTGGMSSAAAYAIKDYIARSKKRIYVLAGGAAGGVFTKKNYSPYAFRVNFSLWQPQFVFGQWAVKRNYRRLFVIGTDYALGRESAQYFKEGWKAAGGPDPVGEIYPPLNTSDFASYLTQIKQAEPDAVHAIFAGADAARFVPQFDKFGLKKSATLLAYGWLIDEDLFPVQGDSAVGNVWASNVWALGLDTPENRKFVDDYKKRFPGSSPTSDTMNGYIAAQAIYEAVTKVGGDVSDLDKFSKAMQSVQFISPRGPFRFDPETNNVITNVYIIEPRKLAGEIHNYVIETHKDIRDPADR